MKASEKDAVLLTLQKNAKIETSFKINLKNTNKIKYSNRYISVEIKTA